MPPTKRVCRYALWPLWGVVLGSLIVVGASSVASGAQLRGRSEVAEHAPRFLVVKGHDIVTATQGWASRTSGGTSTWALALRDTSPRLAALGVHIKITFRASNGQSSVSPTQMTLTGIPAGGAFYLVGQDYLNLDIPRVTAATRIIGMTVSVSTEHSAAGHLVLPPITVTIKKGPFVDRVAGVAHNPYKEADVTFWNSVSGQAVYVVYFNRLGKLIGGVKTGLANALFAMGPTSNIVVSAPPPIGTTVVRASMDPCDTNSTGLSSGCIALQ